MPFCQEKLIYRQQQFRCIYVKGKFYCNIIENQTQKMSFYYLIDQNNLTPTFSFSPTFPHQQFVPIPNIYFIQQETPLLQNLHPEFRQVQIPTQTASKHHLNSVQEPERPLFLQEPVQRSTVKKSRRKNLEKELQSAKKNSESNIINQLFSFFSCLEKSQKIVERAISLLKKSPCQIQKIRTVFYNTVRLMNYKRGRRYVNKQTIKRFYTPQNFLTYIPDINEKLLDVGILSLEELCTLFRVCTYYFVKNISVSAILSSKRITLAAKKEHLKRRRLVQKSLLEIIQ